MQPDHIAQNTSSNDTKLVAVKTKDTKNSARMSEILPSSLKKRTTKRRNLQPDPIHLPDKIRSHSRRRAPMSMLKLRLETRRRAAHKT
ncbi:hypothetical protein H2248_007549 [Termitomyces sp. 'cryptogamus']|nr:hypothetical protein H2248_007549 [Termitomyces sp. 'cryptogamus']